MSAVTVVTPETPVSQSTAAACNDDTAVIERHITVLVPAHNEEDEIADTLSSLWNQTVQPSRVIVIADNCSDNTIPIALAAGATIFETQGNKHKKAGGLNQWLDRYLDSLPSEDLVLVMDADSTLDRHFIENSLRYINQDGFHAVGGVFQGKADKKGANGWSRFVGMLQRNEYARYARDVQALNGKALVLTGTATTFTAHCLQEVVRGRKDGRLPDTGDVAHVYDTKALTEDNELTFAVRHLGFGIIAPRECALETEVMPTWRDLVKQRYRWKRGAVENNSHYGFTRITLPYFFRQWKGLVGVAITLGYIATLLFAVVTTHVTLYAFWMLVTLVFAAERAITVRKRGPAQVLASMVLVIEWPYDVMLQMVQLKAYIDAKLGRRQTSW